MRQTPGEVSDVGYDGRVSPYAYAGAMGEPPAGRDEQIGQMFRNMRSAMGVSRETIARRLATSPSTIDNFEAGAIAASAALEGNGQDRPRLLRVVADRSPSRS